MLRTFLLATMVAASAAAAQSPNSLPAAVEAGQVGERYDGYLGFASPPPPALRRQVNAINIQRRQLYSELATRRNVTADVVGIATGCQLLARVAIGQAYLGNDGVWRHRAAGQAAPVPASCR